MAHCLYIYRLFHYSLSDTKEHNGSQKLLSKVVRPLDNLFYPNKTKLFTLNLGIFNIEIVHYNVEQKASFLSEKFSERVEILFATENMDL